MLIEPGKLLAQIDTPYDLRQLPVTQLYQVCKELRNYIIDMVSIYGGHLGANLGVVELTTAIHYVFNTPQDLLVWDVGHQAYGHKILTGRRNKFHTNRLYKGISGFPKRSESPYDTFGVGHSSTSISAVLGMAISAKLDRNHNCQHIAVIGDGALTAGLAFEGMNQAGASNVDLLIILNDNCMSIDPNVGALKDYLTKITTSHFYNKVKDDIWKLLGKINRIGPQARELVARLETGLKSMLLQQSNLFESLNLRYFGPVDGHNVNLLVDVLTDLKEIPGPKLLHCITTKGKGFLLAEKNQTKWHAPGKFDKITGEIKKKNYSDLQPLKYQEIFGHTIVELAEKNDRIVGITPAMPSGSSMNIMMKAMPERTFDVGIAEQHAVTFSAGLACEGKIPFCNIYSSFMQRAYDQVIHDVCIQNLHVIFCLDRAGFAGADGATHHGAYDLAYMRCLPNMIVSAPMNEIELRNLMYTAQFPHRVAFSIRYPRGKGIIPHWKIPMKKIPIGEGRKIKNGKDLAILTIGHIGNYVIEAYEAIEKSGISVAHYDMRFVKPLDHQLLKEVFTCFDKIITVEDGCIMGGFGSAILEWASDNNYHATVKRLGIPDNVFEHGEQMELQKEAGFCHESIFRTTQEIFDFVQV